MTDPDAAMTPSEATPSQATPSEATPSEATPSQATAGEVAESGGPGQPEATGPTGHPVVDAAVARLVDQAELPPAEQLAGYEAAQRALQQTLASIDQS